MTETAIVATGAPAARRLPASMPRDVKASADAYADAVLTLVAAAILTALPIFTHMIHPAAGMLAAAFLAGACAWRMPQVAVVGVLFAMLFQNLFVSMAASAIDSREEFDLIRGYNFILLSMTWLVCCTRYALDWRHRLVALDPFIKVSAAVFAVVGAYFLVGFALYGMTAVVYLRNIITPMLLFHVCILTMIRASVRPGPALTLAAVLVAACGFIEFFFRDEWLLMTNGHEFWELSRQPNYMTLAYDEAFRKTGEVPTGLLDSFRISFFNSPLLHDLGIGDVMRLFGPNMHAISFAYGLCFFAIFMLYRGRFVLAALFLALLVLASAKGPLILFLLVGASWTVARVFGTRFAFACHCIGLTAYAAIGIVVGLSIGDYHVIGLMGGMHEFFSFPVGHGVGAGGNLSSEFQSIDWSQAQALGYTPFAVESAVGVLFSQLGVFALVVIWAFMWIAWRVLLIAEETGNALHLAAAFSLMTVIMTGLFQEEAYFAPLALGSFMALAGMIVGAGARAGVIGPEFAR